MSHFPESAFLFLKKLKNNNNRDWFNKHKEAYLTEHAKLITFADALLNEMRKHDHIETASGKESLFRIYRDTRFSKDKIPYKTNWSGGFKRATKKLRGGYYFHLEPGNTYVAGGFFGPNTADLKRIRDDIHFNHDQWEELLSKKNLINHFGSIQGESLQKTPHGYPKNHPGEQLLKLKQFILKKEFTDKEVADPAFLKKMNESFKAMRPYFDYMSEVLTTDSNGISLV